MKYFIDKDSGRFLGVFCAAPNTEIIPPANSIEIPEAPENGIDIWTGNGWDTSKRPSPRPTKAERRAKLEGATTIAGLRSALADVLDLKE